MELAGQISPADSINTTPAAAAAAADDKKNMDQKAVEKCIMHYTSKHKILLVGEGDFSFSKCLAEAFSSAQNITATSLDSIDEVLEYSQASQNLEKLRELGATVIHNVDAASMACHPNLMDNKFDKIIFNFPHAGFYFREHDQLQINLHQNVVKDFFENASQMLNEDGEIHVTHKTSHPFNLWNLESLAEQSGLQLLKRVLFWKYQYPGYNNKRGAGSRRDSSFPVGACDTFMFVKVKVIVPDVVLESTSCVTTTLELGGSQNQSI